MQETESSPRWCFVSKSPDPFLDPFLDRDCDLPVLHALYPWLRPFSFLWVSVHRLLGACRGVTRPGGQNTGYCCLGLRASPAALVRGYA